MTYLYSETFFYSADIVDWGNLDRIVGKVVTHIYYIQICLSFFRLGIGWHSRKNCDSHILHPNLSFVFPFKHRCMHVCD